MDELNNEIFITCKNCSKTEHLEKFEKVLTEGTYMLITLKCPNCNKEFILPVVSKPQK